MNTTSQYAASTTRPSSSLRYLPAIGRVGISAIFVWSGFGKLSDPAGTIGYIEAVGLPLPEFGLAFAVAAELIGGILLAVGIAVRPVAGVLAAFSIVTALIFHSQLGDTNQAIHFLKNLALAGGLAQVVAFGTGAPASKA